MKAKLTAVLITPLLALGMCACSGSQSSSGTSQEEMAKGLTTALEGELEKANLQGLDDAIIDDYTKCIVEKSWDKISDKTRETIAKGKSESIADAEIPEADAEVLESNVKDCESVIVDAIIDSNKKSDGEKADSGAETSEDTEPAAEEEQK